MRRRAIAAEQWHESRKTREGANIEGGLDDNDTAPTPIAETSSILGARCEGCLTNLKASDYKDGACKHCGKSLTTKSGVTKMQRCLECSAVLKPADINAGECQHCGARITHKTSESGEASAINSGDLAGGGKLNPAHFPGERKKIAADHGVAVIHTIDPEIAKKMATEGGTAAGDMHVTLAYLGKASEIPSGRMEAIRSTLKQLAAQSEPYEGTFGGHAKFKGSKTSDMRDVHCALVDSSGMHDFRAKVVKALEAVGAKVSKDHGFTPHVTLKYLEKGEAVDPTGWVPDYPVVFDDVSLSAGGKVETFKLSKALWSNKYINNLPDDAFLYIEAGGEKDDSDKTTPRSLRHFPVRDADGQVDLPHLRNALSRIPQSSLPDAVKAKATKLAQKLLDEADTEHVTKAKVVPPAVVDFKEGESGTGVFQTHEMGMLKEQLDPDDFGWDKYEPSEFMIQRMNQILGDDAAIALAKAMGGFNDDLVAMIDKKIGASKGEAGAEYAQLPEPDQKLLMDLRPIHIHIDIRLQRDGDKYWEGGEMMFPGNQYGTNSMKVAAGCYERLDLSVRTEDGWKNPSPYSWGANRMVVEFPDGGVRKGHPDWMNVGMGKPYIVQPGKTGATADGWSRYTTRNAFKWTAGVQGDLKKEFWLEAGELSGLWQLQSIKLASMDYSLDWEDDRRVWVWERAYTQRPESKVLQAMLDAGTLKVSKALVVPVLKADEEKRLITGIVLEPEVVDGQGDIYSADVIAKAAHDFLANYNSSTQIGVQHNSFPSGIRLVESWVTPVAFKLGTKQVKKGSWLMVTHIENDDIWTKVKNGKLTGYSIAGVARVKPLAPT